MYQVTINPNASSSLPTSPPPFTPPNYAVWVNALWFLSLVISITCALLATLLQQWARRYLKVTQPRYSPHKRARIRAFFAEGVNKFLLPWAVEALPTMLHLSLFLFFAGLAVFLWNVNLTIFKFVLSWVGLCTALYGCITFIPVFRHDCPYLTPLSSPAWHFVTGIPFLIYQALQGLTYTSLFSAQTFVHYHRLAKSYRKSLVQGMRKTAEETALKSPSEMDVRAFMWTFDCLDEDHELERFFSGLPGFRGSKMVKDPLPDLTSEQQEKLFGALIGLIDRTSSSDLLPEPVKIRRTVICRKAISPADVPGEAIWQILNRIVSEDQYGPVQSAEVARLVGGWADGKDEQTTMNMRALVSSVIARAQRRDDLWFALAANETGLPESVLRNHATHGDSLSLAELNRIIRQQFSLCNDQHWPYYEFRKVLIAASKFDVLDTTPELQHEFCALWNQVVHEDSYRMRWNILGPIRNMYLMLHQHTDSAPTAFSASTGDEDDILWQQATYPLCDIPGHYPDSTLRIHDLPTSASFPHSVLNDSDALVPSLPHTADISLTTPTHVVENEVDVPMLGNILVPAPSFHAHQTAMENLHDSVTSPDPAVDADTRDNPSAQTMPFTACKPSTPTTSIPPPAAVTLQNNADLQEHSDALEIRSLASELVLDDIIGPSLSLTFNFATHRLS